MSRGQPTSLGKLIRMRALAPGELPTHPKLATLQTGSTIQPTQFALDALAEAHGFATGYIPRYFTVKSKNKQSPPSTAQVELLADDIHPNDNTDEAWFARTSVHENAAKAGTASWEEFDGGLRADHSKHEQEYTPDCKEAHKVLDWDEQLGEVTGWGEVHMDLMEMVHQLPFPMNKRVFSVLVITAKREQEFLVVQIPVQMAKIPGAKYPGDSKITPGMYCSVERCAVEGANVKWQMATASDAKGALPMFIQKLGVPGAVVKDVGLFIGWNEERRKAKA